VFLLSLLTLFIKHIPATARSDTLAWATKVHGPVHHVVDAAITSPTHEAANKVEDLTIVHLSRRDNLDGPSVTKKHDMAVGLFVKY
jgi:hypothetical protein